MSEIIHLTVATLVKKDRQFLMVSETDAGEIVLNQPAGHVEPGEEIIDAAVRETLEETGWKVVITGFVGIYTYKSNTNGITYYRLCFVAKPDQHDPEQVIDSDINGVHWMSEQEIRHSEIAHRSPLVIQCLDDYVKGQLYPLEIFHNAL